MTTHRFTRLALFATLLTSLTSDTIAQPASWTVDPTRSQIKHVDTLRARIKRAAYAREGDVITLTRAGYAVRVRVKDNAALPELLSVSKAGAALPAGRLIVVGWKPGHFIALGVREPGRNSSTALHWDYPGPKRKVLNPRWAEWDYAVGTVAVYDVQEARRSSMSHRVTVTVAARSESVLELSRETETTSNDPRPTPGAARGPDRETVRITRWLEYDYQIQRARAPERKRASGHVSKETLVVNGTKVVCQRTSWKGEHTSVWRSESVPGRLVRRTTFRAGGNSTKRLIAFSVK